MAINWRIKELRKIKGLSQSKMAEMLGVSLKTYQRYEQDGYKVPERVLRQIEATFSVNPEWLRHGKGEMFKPKPQVAQIDALTELFKAMEILGGRVPRAVKRAIIRAFETKDIEGFALIMADYLHDIAEEAKAGTLNIQGNVAIGDSNVQVYKGDKK